MADNKDQNKDAQSGEPVQLDKEQDKPQHGGQQPQPGQQRPQQGGPQQGGGQQQGAQHEGGQRR